MKKLSTSTLFTSYGKLLLMNLKMTFWKGSANKNLTKNGINCCALILIIMTNFYIHTVKVSKYKSLEKYVKGLL